MRCDDAFWIVNSPQLSFALCTVLEKKLSEETSFLLLVVVGFAVSFAHLERHKSIKFCFFKSTKMRTMCTATRCFHSKRISIAGGNCGDRRIQNNQHFLKRGQHCQNFTWPFYRHGSFEDTFTDLPGKFKRRSAREILLIINVSVAEGPESFHCL